MTTLAPLAPSILPDALAPTAYDDDTAADGPTFLRSIAWMMLTLSVLTMSIGGLYWKADVARTSSLSVSAR